MQLTGNDGISCLDKSSKYQLCSILRRKKQNTVPVDSFRRTSYLNAVSLSLLALILQPFNLSDQRWFYRTLESSVPAVVTMQHASN